MASRATVSPDCAFDTEDCAWAARRNYPRHRALGSTPRSGPRSDRNVSAGGTQLPACVSPTATRPAHRSGYSSRAANKGRTAISARRYRISDHAVQRREERNCVCPAAVATPSDPSSPTSPEFRIDARMAWRLSNRANNRILFLSPVACTEG